MRTFTGREIDVTNLRVEDISPFDVAHALSHLGRFCGHTPALYTVAQHSVLVAHELALHNAGPLTQLIGLCHDAAEAYLGDIIRPVKSLVPELADLERKIQRVVLRRLTGQDLEELPTEIIDADNMLLDTELRWFFHFSRDEAPLARPQIHRIECWGINWSKSRWLKRFEELGGVI